jgi:prephenate dehydrogenase
MRVAVIGVGLIGGSIALAAGDAAGAEVAAWDADPAALETATRVGAFERPAASLEDALAGAGAAFVAVPVGALPDTIARVLAAAPRDCVVTDVGSTKRAIVTGQEDQRFVGGHPLAGAETAGAGHARADLFDGATWYLTPTPRSSQALYERLRQLLVQFGARPEPIDADTHDAVMALVSHLPHVLANALVAEASEAAEALAGGGPRLPASGPSFRDATRVAGAPSAIWTDIYLSNRDTLIDRLDAFSERLQSVRALLADADAAAISAWNEAAAEQRRWLQHEQPGGEASRQ